MTYRSLIIALLLTLFVATAAEAGSHRFGFEGELKDGTLFKGKVGFREDLPDDGRSETHLGVYIDDEARMISWEVTIDGKTFESDASSFQSDELFVLDGSPDPDEFLIWALDSCNFSLEFTNDDGTAIDGDSVPLDIDTMEWDTIAFALADGDTGKSYEGEVMEIHSLPLPASAWMGLALLGGLAAVRRRRRLRRLRT